MNIGRDKRKETEQKALQKVIISGNGMQLLILSLLKREDIRKDEREAMENRGKAWEYSLEELRETFKLCG